MAKAKEPDPLSKMQRRSAAAARRTFSRAARIATKRKFLRTAQRPMAALVAAQPGGIRVAITGQITDESPKISGPQTAVTTAIPDISGTKTRSVSLERST
jgi:hypothetical protein